MQSQNADRDSDRDSDRLLVNIPIILSNSLEVPPSARLAGKKIASRRKNDTGRIEIHLPLDLRQDIWNTERSIEFGNARAQDDDVTNPIRQSMQHKEEHRLTHLRLRSEQVTDRTVSSYMIGILHEHALHLHPVSEIHQFKPNLTYLDVLSRETRRKASDSDDSDEDDGPLPDPDEAPSPSVRKAKKSKGKEFEVKEITVTAKKADDTNLQGGLSTMRREMLSGMRKEQEESWIAYDFSSVDSIESHDVLNSVITTPQTKLICKSTPLDNLTYNSLQPAL